MITVSELIKRIERDFEARPGTTTGVSPTGEPYVEIGAQVGIPSIPGTVDEGESREWGLDEETACLSALSCFETYAEGRGRYLYWRHRPVLERHTHTHYSDVLKDGTAVPADGDFVKPLPHPRYRVYMRLLVSEKRA